MGNAKGEFEVMNKIDEVKLKERLAFYRVEWEENEEEQEIREYLMRHSVWRETNFKNKEGLHYLEMANFAEVWDGLSEDIGPDPYMEVHQKYGKDETMIEIDVFGFDIPFYREDLIFEKNEKVFKVRYNDNEKDEERFKMLHSLKFSDVDYLEALVKTFIEDTIDEIIEDKRRRKRIRDCNHSYEEVDRRDYDEYGSRYMDEWLGIARTKVFYKCRKCGDLMDKYVSS